MQGVENEPLIFKVSCNASKCVLCVIMDLRLTICNAKVLILNGHMQICGQLSDLVCLMYYSAFGRLGTFGVNIISSALFYLLCGYWPEIRFIIPIYVYHCHLHNDTHLVAPCPALYIIYQSRSGAMAAPQNIQV